MSEENADRLMSAQQTFRGLPQEILEMTESETACKYCGISYLLLTKVEKMEAHCRQMEAQLENLRVCVDQLFRVATKSAIADLIIGNLKIPQKSRYMSNNSRNSKKMYLNFNQLN